MLSLAGVLAACATLPPEIPEAAACRTNFLALDEKVAAVGMRDGGAYAIPGFPYLRTDRFLASFRTRVKKGDPFEAWVERMRQLDLAARRAELRNAGWPEPEEELAHLDRCGKSWAARDLADPRRRNELRQRAEVPDDYSMVKRTLGLYPLAVPFLNMGIDDFREDVRADYATPVGKLSAPAAGAAAGSLQLWQLAAHLDPTVGDMPWPYRARADAAGIPEITPAQWLDLQQRYAPIWWIENGGDFDRPGAPVFTDGKPAIDRRRAVTYATGTYTRFGDDVLPQLVYVLWFSERPKDDGFDPYAGALDGIVWRVTLDIDGKPLLYDTIHACGCYHYFYTAKPLKRKRHGGFWQEAAMFPQEPAPAQPFAIRVQSRTHYVRRLVPLAQAKGEAQTYEMVAYDKLLSLEDGASRTRSLFAEDGLVRGTERAERFWLWPTGVDSPGAMRQLGRHATSFVGRSHFDDPDLLDRLFDR